MNSVDNKVWQKRIPINYHIIFWVGFFILNFVRWGSYYNDFFYSFKSNLVGFPIHITLSYFHAYYLIPKFVAKRKYYVYIILLLAALTLMYFVKTTITYYLINEDVWPEAIEGAKARVGLHYVTVVLGELYVIGITTAIKLTMDWVNSRKRNQELTKLNLETEIKYLRAQIQPHFFFNTLNNLYALTLEKSDKAPEVVLKLSELMQYVLYEAKDDRIQLTKEFAYIQSYLDLEKLRFDNRLKYNIEISGKIEGVYLPPLMYLPFIENCFKHGVSADNSDIVIDIKFDTSGEMLIFMVENPIPNIADKRFRQVNEGIGIKNIRKRLKLNYNNNFRLSINTENNRYSVLLAIPK
ncbi:MAG: histidine kinase [Bacteroidota bacterium]